MEWENIPSSAVWPLAGGLSRRRPHEIIVVVVVVVVELESCQRCDGMH